MWKVVCFFLVFIALQPLVSTIRSSKTMEGYPTGFLSDCPGSTKPAIITPKSLKYLTITVLGRGSLLNARKTKYNYYQTKLIAKNPDLDLRNKTFLYVGGYLDSADFLMAVIIGKKYKEKGYNVLLLDTNTFTTMDYPLAARYTRAVGKHTAEMLAELTKQGMNPSTLELAGISLGAQTMSFIAKNYLQLTGSKLSRLTAMDPAGPCFRHLGPEDRLDQSDANFVDVISTNIDGFGMAAPVGHVNFYVNGGEYQQGFFVPYLCTALCSHIRSYTLWLSALDNHNSFIAMKCSSVQEARERNCYDNKPLITNVLGLETNRSVEGIFYLATYRSYPFYMGEKGLKRENDDYNNSMKGFEMDIIKI